MKQPRSKVAVLLSGGIDSATVLAGIMQDPVRSPNVPVYTVSIKYPSKHNELERAAAEKIAKHFNTIHTTLDLTSLFESFNSALLTNTEEAIPEGHYEAENMKKTVVPMRNVIFTAAVAGRILSIDDTCHWFLHLGVHAGDHAIYPDCRPETINNLGYGIYYGSDRKIQTAAMFLEDPKSVIVKQGLEWGAPYHLTRTCYTSDELACGLCGSCTERLEAFALNWAVDPIHYTQK